MKTILLLSDYTIHYDNATVTEIDSTVEKQ